ncbi:MAG: Ig-like domain-containing protein [bacterium]|nr:Ig-like domain-containing protein [bacterium]
MSLFLLTCMRCAQVGPLSGGKKDTTPPQLVESFPTINSVNFNGKELVFTFDEYVQVRDLTNQFAVSPKLSTQPTVKAEGKKIVVDFENMDLLPNTTYRMVFGKAICDMNESNPTENFEFVFSTGDHIDTLEVSGTVTDAANNVPVAGALVGLYQLKKQHDSTPYIYVPNYIARTLENGTYSFKNLPAHIFDVFAFTDKNKNNLYDGEIEKIAFWGPALKLVSDTTIHLSLFQEEATKTFIKHSGSQFYGSAEIFLNKKSKVEVTALNITKPSDLFETSPGKEKDTIVLFYKNAPDTLRLLLHYLNSNKNDTIAISIPDPLKSRNKRLSYQLNTTGGTLGVDEKLTMSFQRWMDTSKTDLKRVQLMEGNDSLKTPVSLSGKWKSITSYEYNIPLKEGRMYFFRTDSGAFFDIRGMSNDTLSAKFKTRSKVEFGKVTLKILLSKKQSYVIQLINEQSVVVRERSISLSLSSSNATSIDFTGVPPSTYKVRIVFDDNKNNKWDSGNLLLRKQPERIRINSKQLKIIADWDIEEEIIEKD